MIAERRRVPSGSGTNRRGSSPPSPVLDLPPSRFMAIARVSCASVEIDPRLIAPVQNRLTISLAGSTSSKGTGLGPPLIRSRPRRVQRCSLCSSRSFVNFSKLGGAVDARGVLEVGDGQGREHVLFATVSPLVLAAAGQDRQAVRFLAEGESNLMATHRLECQRLTTQRPRHAMRWR